MERENSLAGIAAFDEFLCFMGDFVAKLRDLREKFFLVNNDYLNGHAKSCGIYATGVYFEICRHASKDQSAFPSINHISEKLGISRPSAIEAIKILEKHNIIKKEKTEGKNTTYLLIDKTEWIPVNVIDQSTSLTSQPRLPDQSTTLTTPVNHVDPKNTNIRILNKNTSRLSDFEFLESLKSNPAYRGINLEAEFGKMDAWLSTKPGRKKTRRFIVNWLNKIERPVLTPISAPPVKRPEVLDYTTTPEQQERNLERAKEMVKTLGKGLS